MIEPSPDPDRRAWISVGLRLLVAFGLLGLVIYLNRAQLRAVRARPIDGGRFAMALGLYLTGLLLAFWRWALLMRVLGLAVRVRTAIRLGFIGNLFNLVIPGAVGGDVVKTALLFREGANKTQAVASVVLDRIVGLLGLFGLAGVVGALAWGRLDPAARRLVGVGWGLLVVMVVLLVVLSSPSFHRRGAQRAARNDRRARRRDDLAAAADAFRTNPGVALVALVMALATHGLNVLAFDAAGGALFSAVPTVAEHAVIVPLVLFSTAIPLPLAALGLSEEVSAQLFRLVRFDGGAVAMMAFRVLQYAGATIGAGLYLPGRRRTRAAIASAELEPAIRE